MWPVLAALLAMAGADSVRDVRGAVRTVGEAGRETVVDATMEWPTGATVRVEGPLVFRGPGRLRIGRGARVEFAQGAGIRVGRTARVDLDGTPLEPIILTCQLATPIAGCWEGVTIEGWAPINHGTATSPAVRGVGASGCLEASGVAGRYGGCDPADSSGVVRFVRIEHAFGGLRLLGVGRGTVIQHVQVHASLGHGIDITGGTADLRYVVSTSNGQFGLAWRGGWQGRAQFVAIHMDPRRFAGGVSGANGFDLVSDDATPRSAPSLSHVTVLAESFASNPFAGTPPVGLQLQRGTAGTVRNVLVTRAPVGLDVDDDATCRQLTGGGLTFGGLVIAGTLAPGDGDADPASCASIGGATGAESAILAAAGNAVIVSPTTADSLLLSPRRLLLPDLRPREGGNPVLFATIAPVPASGFFTTVPYNGAIPPGGPGNTRIPWFSGWTIGGDLPVPPPATLRGVVTSPLFGPLADTRIVVSPGAFATTTDSLGRWALVNLPAGPTTVEFPVVPPGCTVPPPVSVGLLAGDDRTVDVTVTCVPVASVALDAGFAHTCALDRDGGAYCWGAGGDGQLGRGTVDSTATVSPVAAGGRRFQAISAGNRQTCAIDAAQALFCWGDNRRGQLGIGSGVSSVNTPVAVSGTNRWREVSVGSEHVCALTIGRQAFCWGSALDGKLGNGVLADSARAPVPVSGGFTWRSIAAGGAHSCAITTGGLPYCWGTSVTGALGNPAVTQSFTPIPVAVPSGVGFLQVFAGESSTCAIATNGQAYCWGNNVVGQLGTGSVTTVTAPVLVAGATPFRELGLAAEPSFVTHSCGVSDARDVLCWGLNDRGQLGYGTSTSCVFITTWPCALVPGAVSLPAPAVRVVAGGAHTCALLVDRTLWCWGLDSAGQLGDGVSGGQRQQPQRTSVDVDIGLPPP